VPSMTITRYTPRPNHGGSTPHHTLAIDLDTGEQSEFFSRCFECPCGEDMRDGDPALYDANDRFLAHANCEEKIR
jgi:hypothetical protein